MGVLWGKTETWNNQQISYHKKSQTTDMTQKSKAVVFKTPIFCGGNCDSSLVQVSQQAKQRNVNAVFSQSGS